MKHYFDTVANQANVLVAGASVAVFLARTQTLAQLFSDDGVTPMPNPTLTNDVGVFNFYVADGRYDIQVSGPTIATIVQQNVEISDVTEAQGSDTSWQAEVVNFAARSATSTPPSGFMSVYTKPTPKHLFVKDDAGNETDLFTSVGTGAQPPLNSLQYNNAGGLAGSNFIYNPAAGGFSGVGLTQNISNEPGSVPAIVLTNPDGLNEFLLVVDGNAPGAFGNFMSVTSVVTANGSPSGNTAQAIFGGSFISGPGAGTGVDFYGDPTGVQPVAIGQFNEVGDVPTDTNSGQQLIGNVVALRATKPLGAHLGHSVGYLILSPTNCYLDGTNCGTPITETFTSLYGLEIQDLGGHTTTDQSAIKIHAQTPSASGTSFAIEAVPGAGPTQLDAYLALNPTLFANLGTPPNGAQAFCADCAVSAPCVAGGNGAFAQRVNGVWNCSNGTTSNSGTVTSVGLLMPPQLSVSNTPVTSSGVLSAQWRPELPATVLAGPGLNTVGGVFDGSLPATGTGSTASTTITPTTSHDWAFFAVQATTGQSAPPTMPAGWTRLLTNGNSGAIFNQVFSNSQPITATATFSLSDNWSSDLVLLRLPAGAPTIVQSSSNSGGFSNTFLGPFTNPTSSGNGVLAVLCGVPSAGQSGVGSFSDNKGNVYTPLGFSQNGISNFCIAALSANIVGGSGHNVTFTSQAKNLAFSSSIFYLFELANLGIQTSEPVFRNLQLGDLPASIGVPVIQSTNSSNTTCPTPNFAGATCTFTITWPTPFVDALYTASCTGAGTITGFPFIQGISSKTAAGMTVVVCNGVANEAPPSGYSEMDCIARHA